MFVWQVYTCRHISSDIVGLVTEKSLECIAETGFSDDIVHFHMDKLRALYEKSDKKNKLKRLYMSAPRYKRRAP
ncbi:unnamed protein product [Parnassius apollo]|uniref:(apollo) hypothetical protein n=1 Tax=Parnassius apollo TaxID=110799 RepID=A0A8S3WSV7_PARAO|nr:unnamed protein product [Parnassius apollo]